IMGAGTTRRQELANDESREAPSVGELLVLRNVTLGRSLAGLSLEVAAGEVVGVAGVDGNGQRELVSVVVDDVRPDSGQIATDAKIATVREDRQTEGLVLDASVRDNLVLGEHAAFAFGGPLGLIDARALETEARARLERSGAPPDLDRDVRTLSGGNQQRIVVERALARRAPLLV